MLRADSASVATRLNSIHQTAVTLLAHLGWNIANERIGSSASSSPLPFRRRLNKYNLEQCDGCCVTQGRRV